MLIFDHQLFSNKTLLFVRVLRTRKQSGVSRIWKVCKEHAQVSAVNMHSQNSVRHTKQPMKGWFYWSQVQIINKNLQVLRYNFI